MRPSHASRASIHRHLTRAWDLSPEAILPQPTCLVLYEMERILTDRKVFNRSLVDSLANESCPRPCIPLKSSPLARSDFFCPFSMPPGSASCLATIRHFLQRSLQKRLIQVSTKAGHLGRFRELNLPLPDHQYLLTIQTDSQHIKQRIPTPPSADALPPLHPPQPIPYSCTPPPNSPPRS